MPQDFSLTLKGTKNKDGSYTAQLFMNGKALTDADTYMANVTPNEIRELWERGREKYDKRANVEGPIRDCFGEEFFEKQALHIGKGISKDELNRQKPNPVTQAEIAKAREVAKEFGGIERFKQVVEML